MAHASVSFKNTMIPQHVHKLTWPYNSAVANCLGTKKTEHVHVLAQPTTRGWPYHQPPGLKKLTRSKAVSALPKGGLGKQNRNCIGKNERSTVAIKPWSLKDFHAIRLPTPCWFKMRASAHFWAQINLGLWNPIECCQFSQPMSLDVSKLESSHTLWLSGWCCNFSKSVKNIWSNAHSTKTDGLVRLPDPQNHACHLVHPCQKNQKRMNRKCCQPPHNCHLVSKTICWWSPLWQDSESRTRRCCTEIPGDPVPTLLQFSPPGKRRSVASRAGPSGSIILQGKPDTLITI
jgi:hypothetical protein